MTEQNQDRKVQANDESSRTAAETGQVKAFFWKRLLAKRWVFPATYIAAAAIILTIMWVYQGSGNKQPLTEDEVGLDLSKQTGAGTVDQTNPDALAVTANAEKMKWPVNDRNEVEVMRHFFDSKASNEVKQAAMVEYGETLTPHVGIDLSNEEDQPFEVRAAMSGKVTRVEKDPLVGQLVEITHSNGMVTIYQSLSDVRVAKDAEVKQGDVIALAGRNELEKDMGVHLHFEVRQNGSPVNPETLFEVQ